MYELTDTFVLIKRCCFRSSAYTTLKMVTVFFYKLHDKDESFLGSSDNTCPIQLTAEAEPVPVGRPHLVSF